MSIFISFVISTLIFSAQIPNICANVWDDPSTKELEKVLTTTEPIELRDIFTQDPHHNAMVVHLLLVQKNLHFKAHIDRALYEQQKGTFDLLRVHLYGNLVIDGVVVQRGNFYPTEEQVTWTERISARYLQVNGVRNSSIYDPATFNKLLDRLQNATP